MTALFDPVESPEAAAPQFRPSALTTGPWRPDAQHGGPPSALLARVVERAVPSTHRIARLSVELVRPVPIDVLSVTVERTTASRRVDHLEARMTHGDTVVAMARGLALATGDRPTPASEPTEAARLPAEHTAAVMSWKTEQEHDLYHRDAVDLRFRDGVPDSAGPADVWIRLRQPLVANEPTSALCRVMAAVDFGSGVSAIYEATSGYGLINADLGVSLHRQLEGEWVHLQSTTRVGSDGIGLCTTLIGDEGGNIGVATQSLIGLSMQP